VSDIVLAFDPKRVNNAQAIADCVTLGYLRDSDVVLDATYGKGRFWNLWKPATLLANDIQGYPVATYSNDFRHLPLDWHEQFDVTVFDPDYKLTGNSKDHQTGSGTLNADYGLDRDYKPVASLLEEHRAGFTECARVTKPKGIVLFKTMAQVVSGAKRWLDFENVMFCTTVGCRLVDELYVVGHRKQPDRTCPRCKGSGRIVVDYGGAGYSDDNCPECSATGKVPFVQKHSASNVSVLQVYQRSRR
jgi:hypothetical protein